MSPWQVLVNYLIPRQTWTLVHKSNAETEYVYSVYRHLFCIYVSIKYIFIYVYIFSNNKMLLIWGGVGGMWGVEEEKGGGRNDINTVIMYDILQKKL